MSFSWVAEVNTQLKRMKGVGAVSEKHNEGERNKCLEELWQTPRDDSWARTQ